jgi:hypothetical protein
MVIRNRMTFLFMKALKNEINDTSIFSFIGNYLYIIQLQIISSAIILKKV